MSERFFLFKGCLIPTRLPFLEKASLFALDAMKVEYEAMPGATCCVEPIGLRSMAADTWILAVGRMLAIAEEADRDVLTLCNGCYLSFQEAVEELKDLERRKELNRALSKIGKEYRGTVQVRHLLDLVHGRGRSGLAPDIKADLSGLRVAPHSGCHVLRPSKVHLRERPYAPRMLADVAGWLGGKVVSEETWPECCGGGVASVDEAVSSGILEDVTRQLWGMWRERHPHALSILLQPVRPPPEGGGPGPAPIGDVGLGIRGHTRAYRTSLPSGEDEYVQRSTEVM